MTKGLMKVRATLDIIGVNPFVALPEKVLRAIFQRAGKEKGNIQVQGRINEHPFKQTLVKYSGLWRLYINTTMLKDSPNRIGEKIIIEIDYDPEERVVSMHQKLNLALNRNKIAKSNFDKLSPSRKKEIKRYINNLKSTEAVDRNIIKIIRHLQGKGRFAGRD